MRRLRILPLLLLCALPVRAANGPFLPGSEITRESVLQYMNYYRGLHGLAALQEDPRLDQAAADRMTDMEELGYFGHFGPDGRSPFAWLVPCGYEYKAAGENLARGFETAQVLVESWMESPGHRANILSPNFDDVGISVIDGSPIGRAVGRSVVVLFASPKGEAGQGSRTQRP